MNLKAYLFGTNFKALQITDPILQILEAGEIKSMLEEFNVILWVY